jgi:hypothetical protein
MVTKKDNGFDKGKIKRFNTATELKYTRTNRKGKEKTIDLKEMVLDLSLIAPGRLKVTLRSEPGKTVRPVEVLEKIFGLSETEVKQAAIVKL